MPGLVADSLPDRFGNAVIEQWLTAVQKKFTGYRIRYSTSSKMTGAKTVYVSKSSSSKKISNLKSKKKYYVQICSYVKKGKNVFYSKATKKTVKTK